MGIGANSYSSVVEVTAFTRYLLEGVSAYATTTLPTLVEVEKFIDRASGVLNVALATAGFAIPVSQATAKLACDDWVTARACKYVELTQRGAGYNDQEGSRTAAFENLSKSAKAFVDENRRGFAYLGVTVSHGMAEGLLFTGMDAVADRDDPDDTSLEQPEFTRRTFDNPEVVEDA